MKKYNQFINEKLYNLIVIKDMVPTSEPNFIFVINQKNNTIDDKISAIKEIKKHVKLYSWNEEFLISTKYSWEISLYYDINNTNYIKISGIDFGSSVKVNLISLEEFLLVELDGVENYFKLKNDANKFNL